MSFSLSCLLTVQSFLLFPEFQFGVFFLLGDFPLLSPESEGLLPPLGAAAQESRSVAGFHGVLRTFLDSSVNLSWRRLCPRGRLFRCHDANFDAAGLAPGDTRLAQRANDKDFARLDVNFGPGSGSGRGTQSVFRPGSFCYHLPRPTNCGSTALCSHVRIMPRLFPRVLVAGLFVPKGSNFRLMNRETRRIYTFDSFQVDPARRRLWNAGQPVQIHSKTFDLLLALIENSGQELEKGKLLELVWPNQVVEEGNLTVKMSALRKILGERKDEARFIVTIPGRGYRFVADVKQVETSGDAVVIERQAFTHIVVEEESESSTAKTRPTTEPSTQASSSAATASLRTRSKRIWMVASLLFLLTVAGFMAALFFGVKTVPPFERFDVSRQTNSGKVLAASLSPDGQYFVFAQSEPEGPSLWLKHVATGGAQRIVEPRPIEYWGLSFAPDGNHIYATTFEKSHADPVLSKIPVFGGAVQTLPVVTNTAVTFAPGGARMAYIVSSSSSGGSLLWTADADGGNKKFVTLRKDPNFFAMQANTIAWSPKDDTLACVVMNNSGQGFYMTVVGYGANDGKEKRLTDKRWNVVTSVAWTADGRGLVLTGNDGLGLPQQVWYLSARSGVTRRITNDLNSYTGVSLASNSGALLAVQTDTVSAIWTATANPDATLFDFQEGYSEVGEMPAVGWTRDGNMIYQSAAGGSQELWLFDVRGKGRKQLTVGAMVSGFAVSPDGRHIVLVSNRAGRPNLWRLNADNGGDPKQLTKGEGEVRPRFASDGQFVFYQKGFGDVLSSVWKVPIEGGETQQITEPHNTYPDVSPDGKQIVYSYMETSTGDVPQWRLGIAATDSGKRLRSFALHASVTNRVTRWTPDGSGLTYLSTVGGVSNLWLQPSDGSAPRQLTNFDSLRIETFDWSRDGKAIAVVRGARTSDVVLVRDSARPQG
jgi:Tol biopolymer transport system component/DNA-binding winged helix-turn-helix (wHTH) protein